MSSIHMYGVVEDPFDFAFGGRSAPHTASQEDHRIVLVNPITLAKIILEGPGIGLSRDQLDEIRVETDRGEIILAFRNPGASGMGKDGFLRALDAYRATGSLDLLFQLMHRDLTIDASQADRVVNTSFEGIATDLFYIASPFGGKVTAGSSGHHLAGNMGPDTFSGSGGNATFSDIANGDIVIPGNGTALMRSIDLGAIVDFTNATLGQHRLEQYTYDGSAEIRFVINGLTGDSASYVDGVEATRMINASNLLRGGNLSLESSNVKVAYDLTLNWDESYLFTVTEDGFDLNVDGYGLVTINLVTLDEGDPVLPPPRSMINLDMRLGRLFMGERDHMDAGHAISVGSDATLEVIGTDRSDRFIGGSENNIFYPFLGDDTIDGGHGQDVLNYSASSPRYPVTPTGHHPPNSPENLVVNLMTGLATANRDDAFYQQQIANIEEVYGTSMRDVLIGTGRGSYLGGEAGQDLLFAGGISAADHLPQANQIYRLYQAVLDRAPDRAGQIDWLTKLLTGQETAQSTVLGFMGSQEFVRKYGGLQDAAFVDMLYRNVLDRAADAGGKAHWLKLLDDGAKRSAVVLGFADSPEFTQSTALAATKFAMQRDPSSYSDIVYRLYQATLDREPNAAGFRDWIDELTSGMSVAQAARIFLGSPEFVAKYGALNNVDFVEQLYLNVLDRPASPAGLADWVARLERGTAREAVVLGFSESQEFTRDTYTSFVGWMRVMGGDTLQGGSGDDRLVGSALADTFHFTVNDKGRDVIAEIDDWDLLSFQGFGFKDLADLRSHFTQRGGSVVFADQGVEVTLEQFHLSQLSNEMLTF